MTAGSSVYLHPGHLVTASEPTRVTTILGSCVSVCLYDPVRGVGGVNHYLLPHWSDGRSGSLRFGNVAIGRLIDGLLSLGTRRSRLRAKVFGGACVLNGFRHAENHLGMQNVRIALDMLHENGIRIVANDVGGQRGRKLIFHTHDGTSRVRPI